MERILVACPTYIGKDYCKAEYLAAYEALDWPNKTLLMVDTTNYPGGPNVKIGKGMEGIRQYFLVGPYDYWLNLEADIIAPPETVRVLLKYAGKEAAWVTHAYPLRHNPTEQAASFGCSLFSRRIIEENPFHEAPESPTTDAWWWHQQVKPKMVERCYVYIELWGLLDIKHLGN